VKKASATKDTQIREKPASKKVVKKASATKEKKVPSAPKKR
jgi:hypothetical protein